MPFCPILHCQNIHTNISVWPLYFIHRLTWFYSLNGFIFYCFYSRPIWSNCRHLTASAHTHEHMNISSQADGSDDEQVVAVLIHPGWFNCTSVWDELRLGYIRCFNSECVLFTWSFSCVFAFLFLYIEMCSQSLGHDIRSFVIVVAVDSAGIISLTWSTDFSR